MSVGAIVLMVAVFAVVIFEVVSLITTIIKRKKERQKSQELAVDNSEKEDNAQ